MLNLDITIMAQAAITALIVNAIGGVTAMLISRNQNRIGSAINITSSVLSTILRKKWRILARVFVMTYTLYQALILADLPAPLSGHAVLGIAFWTSCFVVIGFSILIDDYFMRT